MHKSQGGAAGTAPAYSKRIYGCDGLRGILAVLIVCYHVYIYAAPSGVVSKGWVFDYLIDPWQLGLSVFFVMSAFLLYRPFAAALLRQRRRPAYGAYLMNRVLRIFPAYWFILAAAAVFGVVTTRVPELSFDFHLPTFLANMFLVHNLHPSGMQTGIAPAWSLAVEWGFYLLLVPLAALALHLGRRATSANGRWIAALTPAAILLVVGLAGREAARRTIVPEDPAGVRETWHAVVERAFPTHADLFAIGMALAVIHVLWSDGHLKLPSWWRPAALVAWLAITLPALWLIQHGDLTFHRYQTIQGFGIAFFFAAMTMAGGDPARDRLLRLIEHRPGMWTGDRSLSIYLWHVPVIFWLMERDVFRDGWSGWAYNSAIVLTLVFALSYLTHRFIELPFMRRKRKATAPAPEAPAPEAAPAPAYARS